MFLSTSRCELRFLDLQDKLSVLALLQNAQTRQYLGGPLSLELAQQRWVDWFQNASEPIWSVRQRKEDGFLGLIFLLPHHDADAPELSYLFVPEFWGQGYAYESVLAVREYATETLGFKRLLAETQSANLPSCRLLNKLDFQEINCFMRFGAQQSLYQYAK